MRADGSPSPQPRSAPQPLADSWRYGGTKRCFVNIRLRPIKGEGTRTSFRAIARNFANRASTAMCWPPPPRRGRVGERVNLPRGRNQTTGCFSPSPSPQPSPLKGEGDNTSECVRGFGDTLCDCAERIFRSLSPEWAKAGINEALLRNARARSCILTPSVRRMIRLSEA